MKALSAVDLIAVAVYLAAIVFLGSRFYRRSATPSEYFLSGRRMSWIPVGISILAADLSAITVMGTPAWAFANNFELLWNSFGFILAAPIVIAVFVPFYARLNLYTAYEYLERRFDVRIRLLASTLFLILRGTHVALVIYAPSLVIQMATGLDARYSVFLAGGLTTLYTTLGGMRAVIWTDVLQFITVMTGILLIFFTAFLNMPGGFAESYRIASEAGRLHALNFSTDPRELTSIWAALAGGLILCMGPLTTDQAILQRLFTTRSAAECRRSVLLQALMVIPVAFLLFGAGTAMFSFYRVHPERLTALPSTDAIVPYFVLNELPRGVAGLVIAAILSASMAVMSAGINSLTTATTVDFYQRVVRPGATPGQLVSVGRWGTLAWGAVLTFAALFAGRLGALAIAYNRVSSVITGPLLGMFLLATLSRRATSAGVMSGALAGGIAVALVSWRTEWAFFWLGPVGCAVTFVCGWLIGRLQSPPDPAKVNGLVVGCEEAA
jgi:solute:Na+ symporter, SSS family